MRQGLRLHPDSRCDAVTAIDVNFARPRRDALVLTYVVSGAIDALSLPRVAKSARADALWQHTCFEAFIRPAAGAAYYEFNFSPSTQWAAYRFDTYRSGMTVAAETSAPKFELRASAKEFTLQAALALDRLPSPKWHLGLSAVLEETNGRKSYWALAHAPGKADFHNADCFTLELP
jgi:hypothetical protein